MDGSTGRTGTSRLAIVALSVLLVLVLGCALVGGYTLLEVRRTAEQVGNLLSVEPTTVIRARGPAVVKQVQRLSKLETSRYTLEKILDAERTRRNVPGFLVGDKLIFVAHGEVVAGLDLSTIGEQDIEVSGDSITMKLPEPQILYTRIDNEKSYVYERETGLLSDADKDLESQVRAQAEQQIRESALEGGILEDARKNGEQTLEALLLSMGFEDVSFE